MTAEEMRRFIRERTAPAPVPLVPEISLHQAGEVTPLWHATAAELARSDPAPFWAFPWAGGQALARHVLDHPSLVQDRRVVDLATGSGLVAIAAARAGARSVTACDHDPFCGAAVALNAALNRVEVLFRLDDVAAVAGAHGDSTPTDLLSGAEVILAGDVFYEDALTTTVVALLARSVARGTRALVGDPGRIYSPRTGLVAIAEYDVPTSPELESGPSLKTRVLDVLPVDR